MCYNADNTSIMPWYSCSNLAAHSFMLTGEMTDPASLHARTGSEIRL